MPFVKHSDIIISLLFIAELRKVENGFNCAYLAMSKTPFVIGLFEVTSFGFAVMPVMILF